MLGNIAYTPDWAVQRPVQAGTYRQRYMPDDIQDWARLVDRTVKENPEVRYWSVWNEPNSTNFFYGYNYSDDIDARIAAYNRLVEVAAPIIRASNSNGRGYVVGLELAAGDSPELYANKWFQGVLGSGGQGHNIDIVAVHHYARAAADTRSYMYSLVANSGVPNWSWPVWLTEVGLIHCNDPNRDPDSRRSLGYCVGENYSYTDDAYQASHLRGVMVGMRDAPATTRWLKTFYYHSHREVAANNDDADYGILRGARAGAIAGRPSFTAYASIAGPLSVNGATYGYGQNVPVTAAPAVPSSYYYVWEYRWCYNGNAPGDCDYRWHSYAAGQDLTTISPYVYRQDYWVEARVRQYAWAGGPQLGSGWHYIAGAGECNHSGCGGGGGGALRATADTTPAVPSTPVPTGASPETAQRVRGRAGRGNR